MTAEKRVSVFGVWQMDDASGWEGVGCDSVFETGRCCHIATEMKCKD